jgi:hypothetical protein
MGRRPSLLLAVLPLLILPTTLDALVERNETNSLSQNAFVDPAFSSDATYTPAAASLVAALTDPVGSISEPDLQNVYADERSGIVASIPLKVPIYPGANHFLWRVSTSYDSHFDQEAEYEDVANLAIVGVKQWLIEQEHTLSISVSELFGDGSVRTAIHDNGNLIQLHLGRTYNNVSFVDSRAFATVKKGNLVNVGFERWDSLRSDFDLIPKLGLEEAKGRLSQWAGVNLWSDDEERRDLCEPELQILTLTADDVPRKRYRQHMNVSSSHIFRRMGYKHVLAWRICPMFETQQYEIMEGIIDAHTGQIYSFVDKVDYFTARGSVYPVSNDGKGTDGEVQPGWPMPFMQVKDVKGKNVVMTDTGGNFFSSDISTVSLKGQFALMNDWCGVATLRVDGDYDWGGYNNGTDCK